jgi:magnesium-transporting ATPase (P-type)
LSVALLDAFVFRGSVLADKTADPVAEKSVVGDGESMTFSSTVVGSWRATALVVATGAQIELASSTSLR